MFVSPAHYWPKLSEVHEIGSGIGFDGFEYGQVHLNGSTYDLNRKDRPQFAGVNLDANGKVKLASWTGVYFDTMLAHCRAEGGAFVIFSDGAAIYSEGVDVFATNGRHVRQSVREA